MAADRATFWRYKPHWFWPAQGLVAGQTSQAEAPVWVLSPMRVFDAAQGKCFDVHERLPDASAKASGGGDD